MAIIIDKKRIWLKWAYMKADSGTSVNMWMMKITTTNINSMDDENIGTC